MGRLPLLEDFPSNVILSIVPRKCWCVGAWVWLWVCLILWVCFEKAPDADSSASAISSTTQLHHVCAHLRRELGPVAIETNIRSDDAAPNNDPPTNVLVLLHGLGDTRDAFTHLGKQMSLPETVCISVQGPHRLLDLGGFHWGDDIIFDSASGGLDADAGFKQAVAMLKGLVVDDVIEKCGYKAREVFLLGFGQGGMAALSVAGMHCPLHRHDH